MRRVIGLIGVVSVAFLAIASPAGARDPGGQSNAGGAVRGIERAEEVANPKGVQHGVEKAERKISTKNNPRNPNRQTSTPRGHRGNSR